MSTRKERKKRIVEQVAADKQALKERKAEINALPPDEKKAAKKEMKAEKKAAKKARKADIKAMPKAERKEAKRHDRVYRKVKNRPRRAIVWTAVLLLVVFLGVNFGPVVADFGKLFSLELVTDTPEGEAARENGKIVATEIADEGIVLVKNEDNSLPLKDATVNVFSLASTHIRYGGGGSGGADQSRAIDLYEGLENAGIEYNDELHALYMDHESNQEQKESTGLMQVVSSMVGGTDTDEPTIDYLTDDVIENAKDFSDNAIIVLATEGVEASDFEKEELRLTPNKIDLIEAVTDNFDNVIIIINAGNTMELGFVEEYPSIKSVLWMGTPGPYGCDSLGRVLSGDVNPSGRLIDTYAYEIDSNPASVNFGDYPYNNIDGMSFINYNEGIYIGYRYYETFYEDDEAGYQKAVQYPFGHGLSYTDFEWAISDHTFDADTMTVDVDVENVGDVAGKDVVQLYYSAPYIQGGVEKSAIELAGYAKTKQLEPGETETVTITFATRDMASYDMNDKEAFVLDAGNYEIKLGKNVHDIVDVLGYDVEETIIYDTDDVTGTAIENQFDYAAGDLTYLSRDDWDGTYPDNSDLSYDAASDVVENAEKEIPAEEGELPTFEADNGIKLEELKGLDYDDPKWEDFLDQFTLNEMRDLFLDGAYSTTEIERLGIPQAILLDGPAGINFFFGNITAASYPTEVVIASTWNDELAYKMGDAVGKEAKAYGVEGWYAPGMNLHRTPQGGRNFEYFSEDPLLSGKMSSAMVQGAQSHDILVFMKHFALNDQETNARSGIYVWANEQAIRELYLRPFEITVKEGDVTGVMSSFVHMGYKWCGGNPELLENVLRDEWGFVGTVTTDAVLGSFMDVNEAVRYGNDLMLDVAPTMNTRYFKKLYKKDPVGIANGLRDRVHNICYSLLQTNLFQ